MHHLKIVIEEKFFRLTVKVNFQIKEYFKNVNSLIFFFPSISYNNVIVRKQTYFSPISFKSWVYISDNTEGVVRGPHYY